MNDLDAVPFISDGSIGACYLAAPGDWLIHLDDGTNALCCERYAAGWNARGEAERARAAPQPQAPRRLPKDALWWAGSLLACCQQAYVQGELPDCIDGRVMEKLATAIEAEEATPPPQSAPHGYAYRYRSGFGDGRTVIRFNNGEEVNGSKPIEAIPYFFGTASEVK